MNKSKKRVFLLGADDPEMRAMEMILEDYCASMFQYATISGKRVTPGNSYEADSIDGLQDGDELILVESQPSFIPYGVKKVVIDHHRPGDPGYDLGPEQFLEASSLGQLLKLLNIRPTLQEMIIAAMDHCFSAAIRGECPGVHRKDVINVKVRFIAEKFKVAEHKILQKIDDFVFQFVKVKEVLIGDQLVKDLRDVKLGEGYSQDLLCMQVAAAMDSKAILICYQDEASAPMKVQLTGHLRKKTTEDFINKWGYAQGLVRIYGVPNRGYAGGYLVSQK